MKNLMINITMICKAFHWINYNNNPAKNERRNTDNKLNDDKISNIK